jgi:hypothetical protein
MKISTEKIVKTLRWRGPFARGVFRAVVPLVMLPRIIEFCKLSLDVYWWSWVVSLAMGCVEGQLRRRFEGMLPKKRPQLVLSPRKGFGKSRSSGGHFPTTLEQVEVELTTRKLVNIMNNSICSHYLPLIMTTLLNRSGRVRAQRLEVTAPKSWPTMHATRR